MKKKTKLKKKKKKKKKRKIEMKRKILAYKMEHTSVKQSILLFWKIDYVNMARNPIKNIFFINS